MNPTLVARFLRTPCRETAAKLIEHYKQSDDPEEVALLARGLASSGERLEFNARTADLASTGGPSSLSTLLCPLFLAEEGCVVPKLGIQGRPAGGIDVMAQLKLFEIAPSKLRIVSIIEKTGFAHFLADEVYAPADQRLFRFRQEIGAQAVRNLVIASILAKKVAVGVRIAGLEIRLFPQGNFGSDIQTALANAAFFKTVAGRLGVAAHCFISDCALPYQPYIGRAEALVALHELFYGSPSEWLLSHARMCHTIARSMLSSKADNIQSLLARARERFEKHIEAHGSSVTEFQQLVSRHRKQHFEVLRAPTNGYVVYDLPAIRDYLVRCQSTVHEPRFPDPVGMLLLQQPHEAVSRGEPVLRVRLDTNRFSLPNADDFFFISPAPRRPFQMHVS